MASTSGKRSLLGVTMLPSPAFILNPPPFKDNATALYRACAPPSVLVIAYFRKEKRTLGLDGVTEMQPLLFRHTVAWMDPTDALYVHRRAQNLKWTEKIAASSPPPR